MRDRTTLEFLHLTTKEISIIVFVGDSISTQDKDKL